MWIINLVGLDIGENIHIQGTVTITTKANLYTGENKDVIANMSREAAEYLVEAWTIARNFKDSKGMRAIALNIWKDHGFKSHDMDWYKKEVMKKVVDKYEDFKNADPAYREHARRMIDRGNLPYGHFSGDKSKTPEELLEIVIKSYEKHYQNGQPGSTGQGTQGGQNGPNTPSFVPTAPTPQPRSRNDTGFPQLKYPTGNFR